MVRAEHALVSVRRSLSLGDAYDPSWWLLVTFQGSVQSNAPLSSLYVVGWCKLTFIAWKSSGNNFLISFLLFLLHLKGVLTLQNCKVIFNFLIVSNLIYLFFNFIIWHLIFLCFFYQIWSLFFLFLFIFLLIFLWLDFIFWFNP
jgi:hypothetical protein